MNAAIGIIGIGNMGLAMALRLRELGWPVRVRDLDAAREAEAARHGAEVCPSPAALAEGIEVEADAAICRQMGFKLMQGYLFGRPVPAAAL